MRKEFNILLRVSVAPLAGAWIEMEEPTAKWRDALEVAPLAGAWIEMSI